MKEMPAGFAQVLVFTQSISSENRGNKNRRRGKQWAGMVLVFTQSTLFQRDRKPRFFDGPWSMERHPFLRKTTLFSQNTRRLILPTYLPPLCLCCGLALTSASASASPRTCSPSSPRSSPWSRCSAVVDADHQHCRA